MDRMNLVIIGNHRDDILGTEPPQGHARRPFGCIHARAIHGTRPVKNDCDIDRCPLVILLLRECM